MALKLFDKLKSIDLSSVSDTISDIKSASSSTIDKLKTHADEMSSEMDKKVSDLKTSSATALDKFNTFTGELSSNIGESLEKSKLEMQMMSEKIGANFSEKSEELQEDIERFLTENGEKLQEWYSDNQINEKIAKVAKKVGAVIIYPVFLLYNLLNSPDTTVKDKMYIILPLAYFILPTDIIPDIIVGFGYADDGLAIMRCVKSLSSSITPKLQEKSKMQCREIFGELDEKLLEKMTEAVNKNQDELVSLVEEKYKNKSKKKK